MKKSCDPLSRRNFLGAALSAGASGLAINLTSSAAFAAESDLLVLENEHVLVAINRATGCVERLESKNQGWKLTGGGMRLHVPAPEHRFHYLRIDPRGGVVVKINYFRISHKF